MCYVIIANIANIANPVCGYLLIFQLCHLRSLAVVFFSLLFFMLLIACTRLIIHILLYVNADLPRQASVISSQLISTNSRMNMIHLYTNSLFALFNWAEATKMIVKDHTIQIQSFSKVVKDVWRCRWFSLFASGGRTLDED